MLSRVSLRWAVEAAVLCCLGWARAQGQDSVPVSHDSVPKFSIDAQTGLTEGSLGWIRVTLEDSFTVEGGEAAGEPLHFEPVGEGAFRALVGVPVETGDSFRVSLFLERGARRDTALAALPVRRSGYPSEVLRVAPGFAKPDSAAAARIQSEIMKSRQVSRRSQSRTRLWAGPFRLPRSSRITSPFGTARVFNGEVQSRHLGTDFAGAVGEPVLAPARGIVALVANFYLAGGTIYLDHGAGLVTAYFHLSRAYVRQGQMVKAGQRIGAVGMSGRVTGPHLHWVARYGTISVDPMSLLQLFPAQP
jgi:murein DD-endopeptidase MepM/ murein hydrolase activator NlpD